MTDGTSQQAPPSARLMDMIFAFTLSRSIAVDEECVTILRNCNAGMAPSGKVLIVEMVIPERNVPGISKLLDLEMLLFLSGRERTETEYRDLLKSAGFELTRIVPTPSPYSVIEGVRR